MLFNSGNLFVQNVYTAFPREVYEEVNVKVATSMHYIRRERHCRLFKKIGGDSSAVVKRIVEEIQGCVCSQVDVQYIILLCNILSN